MGTNTHSEYVVLIAFSTKTMITPTLLIVTLYVDCLPALDGNCGTTTYPNNVLLLLDRTKTIYSFYFFHSTMAYKYFKINTSTYYFFLNLMKKISWTDHVRNEEVLLRVKEQRNILHEIRKWNTNWIGHILRRNCLLQRVIEGKIKGGIEVTGRRGRRRSKLLDDLNTLRKGSFKLLKRPLPRFLTVLTL